MRSFLAFTVAVVLALPAIPAAADAVDSAVASSRGSGLPIRSELEQAAINSASRQAANTQIAHTSLSPLTSICSSAGEIVGAGRTVQGVFDLFLQSGYHRDLLLSRAWTAMGTGAVTGTDGKIYISVIFCTEFHPSAPATPAPAPSPPPPAPVQTASLSAPAPRAPSTPPPPVYPRFDTVLARLLAGELNDLWWASFTDPDTTPPAAPASFVPLSAWVTVSQPAVS